YVSAYALAAELNFVEPDLFADSEVFAIQVGRIDVDDLREAAHPAWREPPRLESRVPRDESRPLPAAIENPTDGHELALVPAGVAIFGARSREYAADKHERPEFLADLPDFYLGKYPVTNAQYAHFLDEVRPDEYELRQWLALDEYCHVVRLGESYRVRGEEDVPPAELRDRRRTGWAH
ncbi:MAG: SUMF1/EgtB/PvdO family nonheme iron enzyme, partial [Gemmatimonadales bacterium]|nr:SUMF1/EgtB/PvdO family nonheme iron enzyme [Gemmatimonadales bacterium]NIN49061.1 SUMF1/EgtB/PvdO family nonheme iron enzyme [Gemmatimonadales bacterium]NIP06525.1 SUMF1/EgtB/PvdO family nonheme iron enzyme [Gemmatimonadales bacterium]NIR00224.1 SUMF1/EgtB/PvdO family nonheme iron enzyme [Gemmatimonadales bacterium]NIS64565.1 SUMF1/EgtB/PvdO family nonheme iron enzyme [Gemmatimonadales bacterium]